ncbi:MAG: TIR domain-containing protein [Nitrospira sp.]|nr:TIR domain-containing protein [Nitrospira sp.]
MEELNSNTKRFDVFLCHNSEDKPEIRKIADDLVSRGLKPWLNEREIRPGTSWQTALGEQIENIKSAAVFVGENGIGPWQDTEIQGLLNRFKKSNRPIIPVLLPSATENPPLPWTLETLHVVDFRKPSIDPLKQLIWGITGEKPDDHDEVLNQHDQSTSSEVNDQNLLPSKNKQVIEIGLPGNFQDLSKEKQDEFMLALGKLLKLGDVKITQVVPGSIRMYLELTPEDADKIFTANFEEKLNKLGVSTVRLYPAIAFPPDKEQRSQLRILLDRVKEYWVEGVLKHSLYNEVLISLGKKPMDEAVNPPWKNTVEIPKNRRHLLLKDRKINTVFDATGLLLILGEPGSGKTTSLLGLASELIERAKNDRKERVPVVLNLSSWKKSQSLADWIAAELSAKYSVHSEIAASWVKNDYLVPLLDGLDEVPITLQAKCVAAINNFIDECQPSGLVVCCRLMEYQWLPERLKLNGAVCLEPLTTQEVNQFLSAAGEQLAGLQQALSSDPVLQELSQTPLMLSIMSLAYEEVGSEEFIREKSDSPKARREQIFRLYVQRMFQRKGDVKSPFPKPRIIDWLSWVAKTMKDQSQSVFLMENLQPNWLTSPRQWLMFGLVVALIVGVSVALLVGLNLGLESDPRLGFFAGCLSGPLAGLLVGMRILYDHWAPSLLERSLWKRLSGGPVFWIVTGLLGGPCIGTIVGSLVGLAIGLFDALMEIQSLLPGPNIALNALEDFGLNDFVSIGLKLGLIMGAVGGPIIGIFMVLAPLFDFRLAAIWKQSIVSSLLVCLLMLPIIVPIIHFLPMVALMGSISEDGVDYWVFNYSAETIIFTGITYGLFIALGFSSINEISLIETVKWKWREVLTKFFPGLRIGFLIGLIISASIGLSLAIIDLSSFLLLFQDYLIVGFFSVLFSGILGGIINGILSGMVAAVKKGKTVPNQGIKLSLKNALIIMLLSWFICGLGVWLLAKLFLGLESSSSLSLGLGYGFFFGLLIGLNRGGSAVLKHYMLRIVLWVTGTMPFNFIKMLDHCSKLILLRKVGGGYRFIHRTLLEYFAELHSQAASGKVCETDSSSSRLYDERG